MERERGYSTPITGKEAFAMFGDRALLSLEEKHTDLTRQMTELSERILNARASAEEDAEDVELLDDELQVLRDQTRTLDRELREAVKEFEKKRWPISLH